MLTSLTCAVCVGAADHGPGLWFTGNLPGPPWQSDSGYYYHDYLATLQIFWAYYLGLLVKQYSSVMCSSSHTVVVGTCLFCVRVQDVNSMHSALWHLPSAAAVTAQLIGWQLRLWVMLLDFYLLD